MAAVAAVPEPVGGLVVPVGVGIERVARPVQGGDGAAAGAIDAVAAGALEVGLEDTLGENAAEGGDDGGLGEGEGAQLPGQGEDVLADGDIREHAVDEAGGGVLHPAGGAAGAGGAGAASIGGPGCRGRTVSTRTKMEGLLPDPEHVF